MVDEGRVRSLLDRLSAVRGDLRRLQAMDRDHVRRDVDRLAEAGWLAEDLANRLAEMARFRNLLVHGYADVDDDRVVEILHSSLGDLEDYAAEIAAALTADEDRKPPRSE